MRKIASRRTHHTTEPLPAAAIGRDTMLRKPQAAGRRARLVEDVDRHAPARIPIAADAQPYRPQRLDEAARDLHRAILMKGAVIAEGAQVKLQRLALDEKAPRHIVDDEMREIRLTRDGTKRGEFGTGEAHEICFARMRIGHFLERRSVRRFRKPRLGPELRQGAVDRFRHQRPLPRTDPNSSSLRKQGPRASDGTPQPWIPAFAGITEKGKFEFIWPSKRRNIARRMLCADPPRD